MEKYAYVRVSTKDMKDPDSFELYSIIYSDVVNQKEYGSMFDSNVRYLTISYSGTNSYGGTKKSTTAAILYLDGSVWYFDSPKIKEYSKAYLENKI